jgi:hypothetical protein
MIGFMDRIISETTREACLRKRRKEGRKKKTVNLSHNYVAHVIIKSHLF